MYTTLLTVLINGGYTQAYEKLTIRAIHFSLKPQTIELR